MRPLFGIVLLALVAGCGPKRGPTYAQGEHGVETRRESRRSTAQWLTLNQPRTDEIALSRDNRADWFAVNLQGKPSVLTTIVTWDNLASDVDIDVFDPYGIQISASPPRGRGERQKRLNTQIDRMGTYYLRVSAPPKSDGTVYTLVAEWDTPPTQPAAPPVVTTPSAPTTTKPVVPLLAPSLDQWSSPRHERAPRPRPASETVVAHVVTAYRQGKSLILYIDKGAAAGIKPGDSGTVLEGSGTTPLPGGQLRVLRVVADDKCVGQASLHSLGHNNRVQITIER